MTKIEIVNEIAKSTGLEKVIAQSIVESLMNTIKDSMTKGENVYLRGFGSFTLKKRAEKLGRNISKNTSVLIPAHVVPSLKFSEEFKEAITFKKKTI